MTKSYSPVSARSKKQRTPFYAKALNVHKMLQKVLHKMLYTSLLIKADSWAVAASRLLNAASCWRLRVAKSNSSRLRITRSCRASASWRATLSLPAVSASRSYLCVCGGRCVCVLHCVEQHPRKHIPQGAQLMAEVGLNTGPGLLVDG